MRPAAFTTQWLSKGGCYGGGSGGGSHGHIAEKFHDRLTSRKDTEKLASWLQVLEPDADDVEPDADDAALNQMWKS